MLQEFAQNIATQTVFGGDSKHHGPKTASVAVSRETTYPVCISLSGAWGGNYHYYLNVDRCAYGVLLKLSANVKGLCGPYIFAVNHNCTAVYYHQDAPHVGWKRYKSVEHYPELQRLLICKPYLSEIV